MDNLEEDISMGIAWLEEQKTALIMEELNDTLWEAEMWKKIWREGIFGVWERIESS